uniref:Uncharacterized protein n=1 Tax=Spongospora subterranea TaxID=70186 RepID=A0A0H5QL15_9EUKA|eukprot:CRZ02708.1 hypothetical protein [Spongospora subterranea]
MSLMLEPGHNFEGLGEHEVREHLADYTQKLVKRAEQRRRRHPTWVPITKADIHTKIRTLFGEAQRQGVDLSESPEQMADNAMATITDYWKHVRTNSPSPSARIKSY